MTRIQFSGPVMSASVVRIVLAGNGVMLREMDIAVNMQAHGSMP